MPNKWGRVLIKPNFIPEAVSIALLGPGVKAAATEKKISGSKLGLSLIHI